MQGTRPLQAPLRSVSSESYVSIWAVASYCWLEDPNERWTMAAVLNLLSLQEAEANLRLKSLSFQLSSQSQLQLHEPTSLFKRAQLQSRTDTPAQQPQQPNQHSRPAVPIEPYLDLGIDSSGKGITEGYDFFNSIGAPEARYFSAILNGSGMVKTSPMAIGQLYLLLVRFEFISGLCVFPPIDLFSFSSSSHVLFNLF